MIRIVVALPAEARPLIQHFGLERVSRIDPLSIYSRPDMALVVSGPGSEAASMAVNDLSQNLAVEQQSAWLNIGVAGHRTHDLGTPCLAWSVSEAATGSEHRLEPPELNCLTADVKTVDRIELEFDDDSVYEMEAFGFCSAALSHGVPSLVQVLKIISDNRETGAGAVSAHAVQTWIERSLPLIDRLVYTQNRRSRQETARRGLEKIDT